MWFGDNLVFLSTSSCIYILALCVQGKREHESFISKCKVWKLKEGDAQDQCQQKLQAKASMRKVGDVYVIWCDLKESLFEVADEVGGRMKGKPQRRQNCWQNDEVPEVIKVKQRSQGRLG